MMRRNVRVAASSLFVCLVGWLSGGYTVQMVFGCRVLVVSRVETNWIVCR